MKLQRQNQQRGQRQRTRQQDLVRKLEHIVHWHSLIMYQKSIELDAGGQGLCGVNNAAGGSDWDGTDISPPLTLANDVSRIYPRCHLVK